MIKPRQKTVFIGASAGGVEALMAILPQLPAGYPLPLCIVLHIPPDRDSLLPAIFSSRCHLPVHEAEDKQEIIPGHIYFAPPNYHLLVEQDNSFSLSTEAPVYFSRPSIDVLFESGADACRNQAIGILLTGGNQDGAAGLACLAAEGGTCIVQDPQEAAVATMPLAAIESCPSAQVASLKDITQFLIAAGGVA